MTLGPLARLVERAQVEFGARAVKFPLVVRLLARYAPIFPAPGRRVLVWRNADVRRVLGHEREMAVSYMPKMRELDAPFFLGLDGSDEYTRHKTAVHETVRPEDLPWIAAFSAARADALLARTPGRIEAVQGVVEPVLAETLAEYLGTGRVSPAQLGGAQAVFHYVFIGRYDLAINRRAREAVRILSAQFDAAIADRRAALARGEGRRDDVLGRMLLRDGGPDATLSDVELRNTLIGLVVAWVPNVTRAAPMALDELLRRPDALREAREAALEGDERRVGAYVLEALRHRTPTPLLERRSARELTLGKRRIKKNRRVLAVVATAMMDPREVERPSEFRIDRHRREYLQFGWGMHRCLGEPIARVQVAAITSALLRAGNLRRSGRAGRLRWDGMFPEALVVERR